MSETPAVTAIPSFGFARGAIVRRPEGGPNMLVVRDLADTVCVVRCEGDEGGTLRFREEPKPGLAQVIDHDGRVTEISRLTAQLTQTSECLMDEQMRHGRTAKRAREYIATLTTQLEEARGKAKRLIDIFDDDDPFDREHVSELKAALSDLRALLNGGAK